MKNVSSAHRNGFFPERLRETTGAASLALVLGRVLPRPARLAGGAPAAATLQEDEDGIVGSDTLIGRLVPISGDTAESRRVAPQVEFRLGSVERTGRAVAQLRALGGDLDSDAPREAALGIYGHTDASGPAGVNQRLSQCRAQVVTLSLRERFGIPATRFRELRGYGETRSRRDLPPDAPAQPRVDIGTFHEGWGREAGDGEEPEREGGTGLRAIE